VEASALPGSVGLARPRLGLGAPLLRLRSDEQLVTLFRDGHEEAFRVIHDRYRQRLHAYARQMLAGSVSDAEDAVQEVFVRAYNGLRSNDRELALRAWLYRIAHNRCIDEIRRPQPLTTAAMEDLTPNPAPDPQARIEQRDALRRLIADVRRLPEQQRSALLMRELGGMPYAAVAEALDVSVPAVKSLLVRARVGLAQAGEARDTACARIREDLIVAHDRGVRTSGLARRHMRDCPECRSFRSEVRGVSKQFAALVPALGPIGVVAKLLGVGGAGGGGAAAGTGAVATSGAAAGGTGAVAGAVAVGAGHVVTLLAAAVVTAGGAIELQRISPPVAHHAHHRHVARAASGQATAPATIAQLIGATATTATDQDAVAPVTVSASTTTPSHYTSKPAGGSLAHAPTGQTGSAGTPRHPLPISEVIDPDNTPADSTPATTGTTTTTTTTPTSATTTGTTPTGTPTTTVPTTTGTPTTPTGTSEPPGSTVTSPGAGVLPTTGTTTTGGSGSVAGQRSHAPDPDVEDERHEELRRRRRAGRHGLLDSALDRQGVQVVTPLIETYLETLDHEELLVRRGPRSGLYSIVAVHSTVRGPSLGGCRMWSYDDARAAVRDALRLSRAMTLKAAVANLSLGGGKGVVMAPARGILPAGLRHAALLDFADAVQSLQGRYITAEDVGTSSRDMSVIAERTSHVAGLARARGGSGDPSPLTALGVEAAIRATCERAFGSPDLDGRSIAIIGLGHVGSRVAKRCARAGAVLTVADVDPRKRALADELGASWTSPGEALGAAVDVVVPCALGGVLDDETAPRLRCRAIAGAANNQLADDHIAELLAARGILWAPDFVANAGGLINIACEQGGYDPSVARRRVRAITATLREIFDRASAEASTPLAAALALARSRLVVAHVSTVAPRGAAGG
jgi:leucine dehydrogenase